jgi:chemotaxis protein MotB
MRIAPLVLAFFITSGCVPKGKYVELESMLAGERTQAEAQQDESAASIAALEASVSTLQQQLAATEATLAAKEAELTALQADLSALQGRNAAMLSDRGALKAEVESMKSALAELAARKAAADARLAEFKSLLTRFKALIDAGTLQVKIVDGRMVVAMATDVLFPSGSATLSKEGIESITQVADILKTIPDRSFQVEGHTDNVPIGSQQFPSNWHLASTRALNVVDHMLKAGMSPTKLSGASFGEFRPIAPNDTKENKALNRRIEIVVVPDLSQLPGYEELANLP